jgi:hypothetical protein
MKNVPIRKRKIFQLEKEKHSNQKKEFRNGKRRRRTRQEQTFKTARASLRSKMLSLGKRYIKR